MKRIMKSIIGSIFILLFILYYSSFSLPITIDAPDGKIFVGQEEVCGELVGYSQNYGPSGELMSVTVFCNSNPNFTCCALSPDGKHLYLGEIVKYVVPDNFPIYELVNEQ